MGIERTVLKNGLTILFEKNGQQSAAINLAVGFGSAFERTGKGGMAHFIEHMFFTGSKKYDRKRVFQTIEEVGGEMNAFTTKQSTQYYSKVPRKHFSRALDVIVDCYNNCLFGGKEIELERKIILNEIRDSIDHPARFVVGEFLGDCLPGKFGRRTLGTKESVSSISRTDLLSQFTEAYNPGNTVIGITAPKKPESLAGLAGLGGKRKGKKVAGKFPKARREMKRRTIKRKTEQTHLCIGVPVMNSMSPDYYAFELVDAVLGGGISSRIVQEVREKKGLSYAVQTVFQAEQDYGFFFVYAATKPQNAKEIESIVLREFRRLGEKKLSPGELARAKGYVEGREILSRENSENRARWLAEAEMFKWKDFSEWVQKVKAVKAEEVRGAAEEYLDAEKYVITKIEPKK